MKSKTIVPACVAITCLVVAPTQAQKVRMAPTGLGDTDVRALRADGNRMAAPQEGGIAGAPIQNWTFEAPTFKLGPVNGQNGWTAFLGQMEPGGNESTPAISDTPPALSAAQWIDIPKGPLAEGTLNGPFGPAEMALNPGQYTVSTKIRISNFGGANYEVIPQAPSQGFLTARVIFWFDDVDPDGAGPLLPDRVLGDIVILDDPDGKGPGALGFFYTGAHYQPNTTHTLTIVVDAPAIRYYLDSTLIYTGTVFAATTVEQVVCPSDNFHLAGEKGQVDDVSIEPGIPLNASVECITYTTFGQGQRLVIVTIRIVDGNGVPVQGASVTAQVSGANGSGWTQTATSNASGNAVISRRLFNTCFTTDIQSVIKSGYVFDGTEPFNEFRKGLDSIPDTDCAGIGDACGSG